MLKIIFFLKNYNQEQTPFLVPQLLLSRGIGPSIVGNYNSVPQLYNPVYVLVPHVWSVSDRGVK